MYEAKINIFDHIYIQLVSIARRQVPITKNQLMNIIDVFFESKVTEQNPYFQSSLNGAEMLYSPRDDIHYNQKHLVECLFFSFIMHTASVEIYASKLGSIFNKSSVQIYLKKLIFKSDPIEHLNELTFPSLFNFRGESIMEEMAAYGNSGKKPIKSILLIYEEPLLLEDYLLNEVGEEFLNELGMQKLNAFMEYLRTSFTSSIRQKSI